MSILFVNACVRQESRTRQLAETVLSSLSGEVTELKLWEEDLSPLKEEALLRRSRLAAEGHYEDTMFRYAKQLAEADLVVIAAPYWDLSFPSLLKVWVENVAVWGLTFRYSDEGKPVGLCRAKKLIYITTAGGFIGTCNFGYDYIAGVFRVLFGITESEQITQEGLDIH